MSSSDTQTHSVVIVEDNVTTNNLLRDWLAPHFKVIPFLDAESAVKDLAPAAEPIAFVVDYNLPAMNGLQFHDRIAASFPQGKYILISGLFDEKLQKDARDTGYHATIPKPFAMPVIFKKIQELLGIEDSGNLVEAVKKAQ